MLPNVKLNFLDRHTVNATMMFYDRMDFVPVWFGWFRVATRQGRKVDFELNSKRVG